MSLKEYKMETLQDKLDAEAVPVAPVEEKKKKKVVAKKKK